MDTSEDLPQTIPKMFLKQKKETIKLNIKQQVWLNNFGNNLYGNCFYCKNYILIPKSVFDKLYPKQDLNHYDQYIPKNIIGTHFDHIISEHNLGKTSVDNLQPICSICNLKKGNKNSKQFIKSKKLTDNYEYNNDYMDMDLDNYDYCKGVVFNNKTATKCGNKCYFRNKCSIHMYQNVEY